MRKRTPHGASKTPRAIGAGRIPMSGQRAGLGAKARQVLEFIADSIHENGLPPTIREIGQEFKISSTNGVRYYLEVLERAGYIRRKEKISRGIEVRRDWLDSVLGASRGFAPALFQGREMGSVASAWKGRWVRSRPLELVEIPILGRVAAGVPIFAEENIEDVIALDRTVVKPGKLFALKVRGDSMKDVGLLDGDTAIVRQQTHADSGDIVVALLGDEATVKRYVRKGEEVTLRPENKDYEPIRVTEQVQFSLVGKVIGSIRAY